MALPERKIITSDRLPGKDSAPGIFEYWESRFANEKFWLALQRGGQIRASERPAYAQRLGEELCYFERSFDFDSNDLADFRAYELLLGLCDWSILRPWDGRFVGETLRVLAGKHSGFNRKDFEKQALGSEQYVGTYTSEENERYREIRRAVDSDTNSSNTYSLGKKLDKWNKDSLLYPTRKRLGITAQNEAKYNVAVLNSLSQTTWDDGKRSYTSPFQRVVDSDSPCTGITLHGVFDYPTATLPGDVFLNIGSKDPEERKKAVGTVRHEYAHTQLKDLKLGGRRNLGRIFDEAMTVMVSEGDAYPEVVFLMNYMDRVLRQQIDTSFLDAFEWTFTDNTARQRFGQFVADNFGYRSLVTLYTARPTAYKRSYGISRIPDIDDNARFTSLWNIVRDERERIAGGADTAFTSFLSSEEGERLHRLALRGNIKLPFQIDRKLQASYAPRGGWVF